MTVHHIKDSAPETVLTDVPLDGSGASLAFTVGTEGYAVLVLDFDHSVNTTSTDITMTVTESPDGANDYELQSVLVSSGVGSSNDASWSKTVAAAKKFVWRVNVLGFKTVTCTIASTGAAATDLISATARMVAQ
jgi:hypothetical protein